MEIVINMKTYSAKPSELTSSWFLIDAEDVVLGRMAAAIAIILRGKHRPIYTPHIDTGDHVVVINAEKVKLTGNKTATKTYHWHTGYPGGIRGRTASQILAGKHPERVVAKAIQRMIPRGALGRRQLQKLKVYAGPDHPHKAQNPVVIDMAVKNQKNKRGD